MTKIFDEPPKIVYKNESELIVVFDVLNNLEMSEDIRGFVIDCVKSAVWLPGLLEKKDITIHRLRVMIFGKGYDNKNKKENKTGTQTPPEINIPPGENNSSDGAISNDADQNTPSNLCPPEPEQNDLVSENTPDTEKKPGHGRMPHTVYNDCCTEYYISQDLVIGDDCPTLCGGTLRKYKPGVIIRIKGQNLAHVCRFTINKLRCDLCGNIFTATIPPEVGEDKYDESFKAMLALMKYYVAIPFYRQENFQHMLRFPLKDSTQWDLIEQSAGSYYAPFNALKEFAANGDVVQNDDTKTRILDVIKLVKNGEAGKRTGMYTTGVIAEYENHPIAFLIYTADLNNQNPRDYLVALQTHQEKVTANPKLWMPWNYQETLLTINANHPAHSPPMDYPVAA